MGDFFKYLDGKQLPEPILSGIKNHRRVDKFTDSHPVVSELKSLFTPARRRFAGIILDVAFDHFLSRNWKKFCKEEHGIFIQYSYDCLSEGLEYMPDRMRHAVHYMVKENWLLSYSKLSGVDRTLNRISHRMRFENSLSNSIEEVVDNFQAIEKGFLAFYPELIRHTQEWHDSVIVAKHREELTA